MKTRNHIPLLFVISLWVATISCKAVENFDPFSTPAPTMTQKFAKARKDGMTMVLVEKGFFIMGSDTGEANERPVHLVYLDSYWIDQTEVTNKMYRACISEGVCEAPLADGFYAPKDHYMNPARNEFPVTYVSWENVNTYCKWAERRLPTEAEWEKAARGVDGRVYPWGNQEPNSELLNFNNNNAGLTKVGSFPFGASSNGTLDMAGNVWEWVSDWYDENYYAFANQNNPSGPHEGDNRVKRGGAYFHGANEVRTTFRSFAYPEYNRSADLGFRCAADMDFIPSEANYFNGLTVTWLFR